MWSTKTPFYNSYLGTETEMIELGGGVTPDLGRISSFTNPESGTELMPIISAREESVLTRLEAGLPKLNRPLTEAEVDEIENLFAEMENEDIYGDGPELGEEMKFDEDFGYAEDIYGDGPAEFPDFELDEFGLFEEEPLNPYITKFAEATAGELEEVELGALGAPAMDEAVTREIATVSWVTEDSVPLLDGAVEIAVEATEQIIDWSAVLASLGSFARGVGTVLAPFAAGLSGLNVLLGPGTLISLIPYTMSQEDWESRQASMLSETDEFDMDEHNFYLNNKITNLCGYVTIKGWSLPAVILEGTIKGNDPWKIKFWDIFGCIHIENAVPKNIVLPLSPPVFEQDMRWPQRKTWLPLYKKKKYPFYPKFPVGTRIKMTKSAKMFEKVGRISKTMAQTMSDTGRCEYTIDFDDGYTGYTDTPNHFLVRNPNTDRWIEINKKLNQIIPHLPKPLEKEKTRALKPGDYVIQQGDNPDLVYKLLEKSKFGWKAKIPYVDTIYELRNDNGKIELYTGALDLFKDTKDPDEFEKEYRKKEPEDPTTKPDYKGDDLDWWNLHHDEFGDWIPEKKNDKTFEVGDKWNYIDHGTVVMIVQTDYPKNIYRYVEIVSADQAKTADLWEMSYEELFYQIGRTLSTFTGWPKTTPDPKTTPSFDSIPKPPEKEPDDFIPPFHIDEWVPKYKLHQKFNVGEEQVYATWKMIIVKVPETKEDSYGYVIVERAADMGLEGQYQLIKEKFIDTWLEEGSISEYVPFRKPATHDDTVFQDPDYFDPYVDPSNWIYVNPPTIESVGIEIQPKEISIGFPILEHRQLMSPRDDIMIDFF